MFQWQNSASQVQDLLSHFAARGNVFMPTSLLSNISLTGLRFVPLLVKAFCSPIHRSVSYSLTSLQLNMESLLQSFFLPFTLSSYTLRSFCIQYNAHARQPFFFRPSDLHFILVINSLATQIKVILKTFPIPDLKVKFSYVGVKTCALINLPVIRGKWLLFEL